MHHHTTKRLALPQVKAIGIAAALALGAAASHAGEGSSLITSFSYVVSGGALSWLDPYQSFQANALAGGGLLGARTDSFATNDWGFLIVGASIGGAVAGISTQTPQLFWADAVSTTTTGPANTLPNQAQALGLQSGAFTLSQAGSVTFTVGYTLGAFSAGGNTTNDYSSAAVHFNASNANGSSGGDRSDSLNSFSFASNAGSKTGSFTLTVALGAGETGYYTLDGSAVAFSPVTAVPEPSQWALMGAGLLGMAALSRRRSSRQARR